VLNHERKYRTRKTQPAKRQRFALEPCETGKIGFQWMIFSNETKFCDDSHHRFPLKWNNILTLQQNKSIESTMSINWNKWSRKLHRWGSILIAIPFLIVILSGILLQLKKEWGWIQPKTQKVHVESLQIGFDRILEAAKKIEGAKIESWDDIKRLDVRPSKGIVKVRAKNGWEIQLALDDARVLQVEYRRSDLIESLHDGSWFDEKTKLWVFLPSGVIVFGLWFSGMYLFLLPHVKKRQKKNRQKKQRQQNQTSKSEA